MKFALKKSVSRSGLTAALSLAVLCSIPSLARADAVAQSILNITGFKITTPTATPVDGDVTGRGGVNASLNGASVASGPLTGGTYGQTVSLGVGYIANSKLLGAPTNTFSGGRSSVSGSSFSAIGASALADSTVSLRPAGFGTSDALTGTDFSFTFATLSASTVNIVFDADLFLRAFLAGNPILVSTPAAGATVNSTWSVSIAGINGDVFRWQPDGAIAAGGVIFGGVETSDPFSLTRLVSASRNLPTPQVVNSAGSFAARSNTLAAGNYTLTIQHKTDATANLLVPEPGTLALVGLSLVGLAVVGRRRAMRQAA